MIYLKSVTGICYREDRVDIEVIGRSFTGLHFLGSLSLTQLSGKDPLLIKAEVKAFFNKIKTNPETVVVSVTPDQVAFRKLTLPAEAQENLAEAIRLQLINIVPTEPEEYCLDWILLPGADEKTITVDLYIMPRQKVQKILNFLKAIGISPNTITLTAFAFSKMLNLNKELTSRPVFLLDLDQGQFAVYLYEKGKFTAFKEAAAQPEVKTAQTVLKEIESAASQARLPDDSEIELVINFSDPGWKDTMTVADLPSARTITACSPFPERTTEDLKTCATALAAMEVNRLPVNLIPKAWRKKVSTFSVIPTIVLIVALVGVLVLTLGRGFYQEAQYIKALEHNIAKYQNEYQAVQRLKHEVGDKAKQLETLNVLVKKPRSDIEILRELTEKAGPKTYMRDYLRDEKLVIQGNTDSVLDLETRLKSIRYFKSVNMEGSLMRAQGMNLENFRFNILLEE